MEYKSFVFLKSPFISSLLNRADEGNSSYFISVFILSQIDGYEDLTLDLFN